MLFLFFFRTGFILSLEVSSLRCNNLVTWISTQPPCSLIAVTLVAMKSALGWSDDDDDSFEENEEESEKQEGPVRNKNTSGEISEDEQESESNGNAFFAEVLSDFQDQVGQ